MLSDETLSAYLDGELNEDERRRVEAAIEADVELSVRLSELVELRSLLGATELQGPSRDLWAAIETEVNRPRWWELRWVKLGLPLGVAAAAAAAVLILAGAPEVPEPSAPIAGVEDMSPEDDRQLVASAESEIARAKQTYLAAIERLERRAERYTERLPDEERMKLQTSLFEVEQAIARVEGVIHDNPTDVSAHTTLVALYDQKMRVLKSTVDVAESFLGQPKVEK